MKRFFSVILSLFGLAMTSMAAVVAPQYPGGDEAMNTFINTTMIYPAAAKANGIEGVVDVAFTVKSDGSIGSIKIVRMIDPDLEQEAIRIIKNMPKWLPAKDNGTPVDAPVNVKINFVLE